MKKPVKKPVRKSKPIKKRPLVAHHRHTGRRLSREHTSYPLLAFILLCIGVMMMGITIRAGAAILTVNATVLGTPPPTAATITSHTTGDHVQAVPIDISGTCPAGYLVRLERNNIFSGAAYCAVDDTFIINTDLFEGNNDLQTRVYNGANLEGPLSPIISIIYDMPPTAPLIVEQAKPPTPTTSTSDSGGTLTEPVSQLVLTGDNLYMGYNAGDIVTWMIDVKGGETPFTITIDWGDGTVETIVRQVKGVFTISHTYKQAAPSHNGSYVATVKITDKAGQQSTLQLVALVSSPSQAPQTTQAEPDQTITAQATSSIRHQLLIGWPIYFITALMLVSFWLGERRVQLHKVVRRRPLKHA